ncbi:MAG: hypothetical protein ACI86X_002065 [Moritella sp.]|jgi:hypothetical protein
MQNEDSAALSALFTKVGRLGLDGFEDTPNYFTHLAASD